MTKGVLRTGAETVVSCDHTWCLVGICLTGFCYCMWRFRRCCDETHNNNDGIDDDDDEEEEEEEAEEACVTDSEYKKAVSIIG